MSNLDSVENVVKKYFEEKGLPYNVALTFEDVYLINRTSRVEKRSDIGDFRTRLARDIFLNIPFVSANMADVTESRMATALARLGGCGFIHQFAPIQKRVAEVKKVKRADHQVIENPVTVRDNDSLEIALSRMRMQEKDISGVLVIDNDGMLVGILTARDVKFRCDELPENPCVKDIMTSQSLITAGPDVSLDVAKALLGTHGIEKLPLVDGEGRPVGLITGSDIIKRSQFPKAVRDERGRLCVGAAVGISGNYIEEIRQLLEAGSDVVLIDAPNANTYRTARVVREAREEFRDTPFVAGNVDNAEGCLLLIKAGADCVKVGIGGGSACKTRMVTGIGAPQMRAIPECVAVSEDIPVIGDGGFNEGHKIAKGLVAGASCIMLGGLLAATEETPGEVVHESDGTKYKVYRGSAGIDVQFDRVHEGTLDSIRTPEGETRRIPYEGKTAGEVIDVLLGGLRSSMGFANAFTLRELREMKFMYQTRAAFLEGQPKE